MKIIIEEYQASWPNDFLKEEETIAAVLIEFNPLIEHIGSTSIPGICAKPTIDMLIGLQNEEQLDKIIYPMTNNDYTYIKKYEHFMPCRRLFSKLESIKSKMPPEVIGINDEFIRGQDFEVRTNIHIVKKNTLQWVRHLAFRDFLRTHFDVRDEYSQLKKELAKLEFKDAIEYNNKKNSFIKKTESDALTWFYKRQGRVSNG